MTLAEMPRGILTKQIEIMKNHVAQQIIVPVYYYVDEYGSVTFDIEQMNEYFQGELQKVVFSK